MLTILKNVIFIKFIQLNYNKILPVYLTIIQKKKKKVKYVRLQVIEDF